MSDTAPLLDLEDLHPGASLEKTVAKPSSRAAARGLEAVPSPANTAVTEQAVEMTVERAAERGPEQVRAAAQVELASALTEVAGLAALNEQAAVTAPAEAARLSALHSGAEEALRQAHTELEAALGAQDQPGSGSEQNATSVEQAKRLLEDWKAAAIAAEQAVEREEERLLQEPRLSEDESRVARRDVYQSGANQLDGLITTLEWLKATGQDALESDIDMKITALTRRRDEWLNVVHAQA